jgi:ribosome-interacting GTPase 1
MPHPEYNIVRRDVPVPANLPPQYFEAEKLYRQAKTPQEKIEALEQMLAIMPKHKGTDHLRGELRARIARLSEEAERRRGPRSQLYVVKKEGAGQLALVGPPNAGKSQLLAALTGAQPKIGPYPFTTVLPMPAMMPYENVWVQLVDLPPVGDEGMEPWMRALVRQADAMLLLVDLAGDPLSQLEMLLRDLEAARIEPVAPRSERGPAGEEGLHVRLPAVVAANKLDLPDGPETYELFLELVRAEHDMSLPIYAISAQSGAGLEELKRALYAALDVVRVYTRPPHGKPDFTAPTILPRGSTVEDLAAKIHKDLQANLKYALVWGSTKFDGQRVGRDYVLADGDVVELVE